MICAPVTPTFRPRIPEVRAPKIGRRRRVRYINYVD